MLQVLYYTALQKILKRSIQVAACLSEVFTNRKVNTTVPISIMQLEKFIEFFKMQMSKILHQDINEFYDNITDALLDDDMIPLHINLFF